jgi:hypothetical protein
LPSEWVWSAIEQTGRFDLAKSLAAVQQCLVCDGTPLGFPRFFDKFAILDKLPWCEKLLKSAAAAVVGQLEREQISYVWLRVGISKYLSPLGLPPAEILELLLGEFDELAPGRVGLILALRYDCLRPVQQQIANVVYSAVADRLVGIDLVGSEYYYDAQFYAKLLRPWRDAGKRLFAHVGEICNAENVDTAIRRLGVTDVCHGLAVLSAPDVVRLAVARRVCFHQSITSNWLTGAVRIGFHPIARFLRRGLLVTLGSDDPVVCQTTLAGEYHKLRLFLPSLSSADPDEILAQLRQTATERTIQK